MTNERAIEILDPEHREHYESIEPVNEACRMGMEAFKKQMPKPPILDIIYPSGIKSYKCPVCGKGCLVRADSYCLKYCSDCGRALDWRDTE